MLFPFIFSSKHIREYQWGNTKGTRGMEGEEEGVEKGVHSLFREVGSVKSMCVCFSMVCAIVKNESLSWFV